MTVPNYKTEAWQQAAPASAATSDRGVDGLRQVLEQTMAIRVLLVPAGQAAPPATHELVRIQCRRQSSAWPQQQAETAALGRITLPLPLLAAADYDELWLVDTAVESLQLGPVQVRRSGTHQICWLWFQPQTEPATSQAATSRALAAPSCYARASEWAYQQILACQMASPGQRRLQKIWHYLPALNHGHGDAENYRQFCQGRELALNQHNSADFELHPLPAATAIGIPDPQAPALFYWLSSSQPGTNVENPRQTQAWRYPRQYGPARPNFSRATCSNSSGQFLISGTASVVGHATAHPYATQAQTTEMLANLESLLAQGLGEPPAATAWLGQLNGPLRVYVRDTDELSLVLEQCREHALPQQQLLAFHGDICRIDLMVEVDGLHQL